MDIASISVKDDCSGEDAKIYHIYFENPSKLDEREA